MTFTESRMNETKNGGLLDIIVRVISVGHFGIKWVRVERTIPLQTFPTDQVTEIVNKRVPHIISLK